MQKTLMSAGFLSLILAVILYALGYTNFIYEVGNGQVLLYPAAFFTLLGLVLMYRAVRSALRTADN